MVSLVWVAQIKQIILLQLSNENQSEQTTGSELSSNEETSDTDADTASAQSSETLGQKNAVSKTKSYLDYTAFSYTGLIDQLEFEGFTTEEATYAVDNCGADWK